MGLFGKKKKDIDSEPFDDVTLPDLPESPEGFPSIEDYAPNDLSNIEINELPSLPKSNSQLNPSEIKSAVNETPYEVKRPLGEPSSVPIGGVQRSKFQVVESPHSETPVRIGHGEAIPKLTRSIAEPSRPAMRPTNSFVKTVHSKEIEPIYVKLDKFQTTVSAFEEIKTKVLEIENMLTKIKEVREREDRELEEWENEVQVIKSRIESVDRDIFDKFD